MAIANEIQFTGLGILLALLFLFAMAALYRWMFLRPERAPLSPSISERIHIQSKRILVPTSGRSYSEQGIDLACALGQVQKADIYLVHIIEVSMTLPLDAHLPEAEVEAGNIIKRGETVVHLRGLEVKGEIRRARVAWEEIIRVARDWRADMIVMGIPSRTGMIRKVFGCTSDLVRRNAPCEVILAVGPQTQMENSRRFHGQLSAL